MLAKAFRSLGSLELNRDAFELFFTTIWGLPFAEGMVSPAFRSRLRFFFLLLTADGGASSFFDSKITGFVGFLLSVVMRVLYEHSLQVYFYNEIINKILTAWLCLQNSDPYRGYTLSAHQIIKMWLLFLRSDGFVPVFFQQLIVSIGTFDLVHVKVTMHPQRFTLAAHPLIVRFSYICVNGSCLSGIW